MTYDNRKLIESCTKCVTQAMQVSHNPHVFFACLFIPFVAMNQTEEMHEKKKIMFQTFTVDYPFSSVQFNSRWYLCAREGPYALHPISGVFPMLPWNRFQCWSDWRWPFLILSSTMFSWSDVWLHLQLHTPESKIIYSFSNLSHQIHNRCVLWIKNSLYKFGKAI